MVAALRILQIFLTSGLYMVFPYINKASRINLVITICKFILTHNYRISYAWSTITHKTIREIKYQDLSKFIFYQTLMDNKQNVLTACIFYLIVLCQIKLISWFHGKREVIYQLFYLVVESCLSPSFYPVFVLKRSYSVFVPMGECRRTASHRKCDWTNPLRELKIG